MSAIDLLRRLDALADAAPEFDEEARAELERVLQGAEERAAAQARGAYHGPVAITLTVPLVRELLTLAAAAQPGPLREAATEIRRVHSVYANAIGYIGAIERSIGVGHAFQALAPLKVLREKIESVIPERRPNPPPPSPVYAVVVKRAAKP